MAMNPMRHHAAALASVLLSGLAWGQVSRPASGTDSAPPPAQYAIKAERPVTGSHIRRDAMRSSGVAINRRYEQLTPEERARWESQYEAIAPGDEPPFPAEGLKALYEPLTQANDRVRALGELRLVASVAADGTVQEVRTLATPDPRLSQFAAQLMLITPFKPARCQGQPCAMEFPLQLRFSRR